MNLFNIVEIIDMGIEKEKKRRDFYAQVAEIFKENEMRELFAKLRDWEEGHIKKFNQIKESVNQDEATDSYPGEMSDYINSIVDDKLYKEVSPANFSQNVKKPIDAINYGIGFEKDAIIFFNELLLYVSSYDNKDAVQKLINEEKEHLVYLALLRKRF